MAYVSRSSEQATIFPANNLPSDSKVWGQNVEKRIFDLESNLTAAEINNTTRDSQIISSYERLDATVTNLATTNAAVDQAQSDSIAALEAANQAVQEILDLGAPGGPTINAENITAGTLTGITVQTGASGTRSKLSGSNIEFFSSAYVSGLSRVGYIQGDDGGDPGLYIISDQGEIALDAISVTISADTTITGELAVLGSFNPSSVDTGSGSISGGAISGSSLSVGTSEVNSSSIYAQSITGDSVGGGLANFTGSVTGQSGVISNSVLTRTQLIGGGTTGASVTDGGNFVRTSSSARYKQDIESLDIPYEAIIGLEPKKFRRKDEVESRGDEARYYPGFIAEDLAGTPMDIFAFYERLEDGSVVPGGIHYPELTAALVLAIKQQHQTIESLTARLEALESKVQ